MPPLFVLIFWGLSSACAAATLFVGLVKGWGGLLLDDRLRAQITALFTATVVCFLVGLLIFIAAVL